MPEGELVVADTSPLLNLDTLCTSHNTDAPAVCPYCPRGSRRAPH
jgi:hypothetical protein